MSGEKNSENFMQKLARFIVDKRKAFFLVFIIATVFCAASISKVKVNNDITSYLPDTGRRGPVPGGGPPEKDRLFPLRCGHGHEPNRL